MKKTLKLLSLSLCTLLLLTSCGKKDDTGSKPTDSQLSDSGNTDNSDGSSVPNRTIGEALNLANNNSNLVNGGAINHSVQYGTANPYAYDISFAFGTDKYGSFVSYNFTKYSKTYDYHFGHDSLNNPIGIESQDETILSVAATEDNLKGYHFKDFMGGDLSWFGVESFVSSSYTLAKENKNGDFYEGIKNGLYHFEFGYLKDSYTFFFVEFDFSVFDDIIENTTATSKQYGSQAFLYDDLTQSAILQPSAKPSTTYKFTIQQEKGNRDAESKYDVETYYYSSFDLVNTDTKEVIGDTISMYSGTDRAVYLDVDNMAPSTALASFDSIKVEVVEGDVEGLSIEYNKLFSSITIIGYMPGDYVVTVSTNKVVKEIDVHVEQPLPKGILVMVAIPNDNNDGYNSHILTNTPYAAYVDNPVYFTTSVNPTAAVQTVEFSLVGENTDGSFSKETIYNAVGNPRQATKFTANSAGTYIIRAKSTVNETYTDVTLIMNDIPKMNELFNGEYIVRRNSQNLYGVNFTPNVDDEGLTGEVKITSFVSSISEEATYSIDSTNRKLTITHVSGDYVSNSTITYTKQYDLYFNIGSSSYELNRKNEHSMIDGTWKGQVGNVVVEFRFDSNGACSYSVFEMNGDNFRQLESTELYFALTKTEDNYMITWSESNWTNASLLDLENKDSYLTSDYANVYLKLKINNVDTLFKLEATPID